MKDKSVYLIYAKERPLCHAYCHFAHARQTVRKLLLINTREDDDFINETTKKGLDVSQVMALKTDN